MKVGTGGNLDLSREYHMKLFGPLFYTWWNCPLNFAKLTFKTLSQTVIFLRYSSRLNLFRQLCYQAMDQGRYEVSDLGIILCEPVRLVKPSLVFSFSFVHT